MKRRRKPRAAKARAFREAVKAKRRARAFYRMRRSAGADVLPAAEAGGLAAWRGCGVAALALLAFALLGWAASKFVPMFE